MVVALVCLFLCIPGSGTVAAAIVAVGIVAADIVAAWRPSRTQGNWWVGIPAVAIQVAGSPDTPVPGTLRMVWPRELVLLLPGLEVLGMLMTGFLRASCSGVHGCL